MKKVGLVTFFHSNYGSVLQAFATRTFLEQMGYEPVSIVKEPFGEDPADIEANRLRHPQFMADFQKFMASLSGNNAIVSEKSMAQIDAFVRDTLRPVRFSMDELREAAKGETYCAFIAGSDQVWNCSLGMLSPLFFLLFAPPEKRIALCPSFGASTVPDYLRDDLREVLNTYSSLSVREDEGVAIVRDITGRQALRLADPTLLLTPDDWRRFAGVSPAQEQGYLLLHFLNAPNDAALRTLRLLMEKTSLPVKCFATRHSQFAALPGLELLDGGPKDYVRYIDHAALVLTDSFHTTMFSINLDTDFYVFDRQYVHGVSQISRINTALNRYGLTERLLLDASPLPDPENMHITKDCEGVRNEERAALQQYLTRSLAAVDADP